MVFTALSKHICTHNAIMDKRNTVLDIHCVNDIHNLMRVSILLLLLFLSLLFSLSFLINLIIISIIIIIIIFTMFRFFVNAPGLRDPFVMQVLPYFCWRLVHTYCVHKSSKYYRLGWLFWGSVSGVCIAKVACLNVLEPTTLLVVQWVVSSIRELVVV